MLPDISSEKPESCLEGFVTEFYNDRLSESEQLKGFLNSNDLESIRAMAHKWKGFCDPYGFQLLGTLSKDLENSCVSQETLKVQELVTLIEEYLTEKAKYIK